MCARCLENQTNVTVPLVPQFSMEDDETKRVLRRVQMYVT